MKYYQIVEIDNQTMEGWNVWEGFDYNEALKAKEKALSDFDHYHTPREKSHRVLEFRLYEIPDDTDIEDEMELAEATLGDYDNF